MMKSCDNCIPGLCEICKLNKDPNADTRNLIGDMWKLDPAYYDIEHTDLKAEAEPPLTEDEIWQIIQSGYDYKPKPMSKRAKARANKLYKQIKDLI